MSDRGAIRDEHGKVHSSPASIELLEVSTLPVSAGETRTVCAPGVRPEICVVEEVQEPGRTGCRFMAMVALLVEKKILLVADGFNSQELVKEAESLLLDDVYPMPKSAGTAKFRYNSQLLHFTLAVDAMFSYLVASTASNIGWPLVSEVHRIWRTTDSTGDVRGELTQLAERDWTSIAARYPLPQQPPSPFTSNHLSTTESLDDHDENALHPIAPSQLWEASLHAAQSQHTKIFIANYRHYEYQRKIRTARVIIAISGGLLFIVFLFITLRA